MKLLMIMAALLCVCAARAQDRIVSLDAFELGYTGGLLIKHDNGEDSDLDKDENQFKLNLNYAQKLGDYPNIMLKGVGRINHSNTEVDDSDASSAVWALTGGAIFNHDAEDIKNSLFAGAQVGFEWQSIEQERAGSDLDESGFNFIFSVEGGKRWHLGDYAVTNISYAPSIELLYRRYGGGIRDELYTSGHEIKLNFLKFDVMF